MKTVAFFYTPPIEIINLYTRIIIELVEENLSLNNNIKIIICEGKIGLNKCVANYRGDRSKCYKCKKGLSLLKNKYSNNKHIEFIKYFKKPEIKLDFNSINDLKKINYKGINIGYAVHSTAITTFRDHLYKLNQRKGFIISSLISSIKTLDVLFEINADHVYTFNGRTSHYNAIKNFAKHFEIDYSIFEVTANKNKYLLLKNKPLHSVDSYTNQIEEIWGRTKLELDEKEKQARRFFDINSGRYKDPRFNINVFSKDNVKEKIESLRSSNKRVISIFNKSRSEFECVEGWNEEKFYDDDEDLINEVCEYFEYKKDFLFILRVHPNLKFLKNTQNNKIKKLSKNKNLIIISPEDKLSSYGLIRISDLIITFGSTIGVESTYMGKKTISIGDSLYKNLDCTYTPKSFNELIDFIKNENLAPKPSASTYKYGFYILNNGNYFRLKKHDDIRYSKIKYWLLKFFNLFKYISKSNLNDTIVILKRYIY